MKKLILIFLFSIMLCQPSFATDWFVDMNLATGANDGTSTDDAWQSIKTGIEYGSLAPGDKVWIKRDSVWDEAIEGTNANISPVVDGDANNFIEFIGWPRAEKTINCDWVNGSTTVDNVDSNDMDREQHAGRGITGPDGFRYIITYITDSNTFVIDREYAGSTSSDEDVTIEEDVDYDEAQSIDDSAWTIKLSTWTDDADDLPVIDFNNESYCLYNYKDFFFKYKNIMVTGSEQNNGSFFVAECGIIEARNCLFIADPTGTRSLVCTSGYATALLMYNCIMEGNETGASEQGVYGASGHISLYDSAIYGVAQNGIYMPGLEDLYLYNVNVGIEVANGADELSLYRTITSIIGHDVKLGGTNGLYSMNSVKIPIGWSFYNYGKILGSHRTVYEDMTIDTRVDVTTVMPNKKNSDYVLEVDFAALTGWTDLIDTYMFKPIYKYQVPQSSSKTYRLYIYNNTGQEINNNAVNDLCLRCRYIDEYDDASEYHYSEWQYSTQTDIDQAGTNGADTATNGDMELDAEWTGFGLEGGETVEQSSTQAHGGTYSWYVNVDNGLEGIYSSTSPSWTAGDYLKVVLWFYPVSGSFVVDCYNNGLDLGFAYPWDLMDVELNAWNKISVYFVLDTTTSNQNFIRFRAQAGGAAFYVDDVEMIPITPDGDDWDYVEVGPIVPAVRSDVFCELLVSRYGEDDLGNLYVDPYIQNP